MQLEAVLRSRDQEVSSLTHRSANVQSKISVQILYLLSVWLVQCNCTNRTDQDEPRAMLMVMTLALAMGRYCYHCSGELHDTEHAHPV